MILKFLTTTLLAVGLIVALGAIYSVPTYFLWNWLFPKLFNLPYLTIWEALGLTILCKFLFGSLTTTKSE